MIEMLATVAAQQAASHAKGLLTIWTVYDHPADYPQGYVARCFEMDRPTDAVLTGDLGEMRRAFVHCGLVMMMRHPTDDPVIMETWL